MLLTSSYESLGAPAAVHGDDHKLTDCIDCS